MRIGLAADNGNWHKSRLLAALTGLGVEPVLFSLADVAVVTGGAQGIGLAIASYEWMAAATLLIVGMVMESIAAILILAPILTPALMAAGVDPVQLGVVVVLNLMIGLLTPPVGMSLYMVSSIARLPLQRVVAGAMPWLIPLVLALAVVTFVPVVSTWLPNLIMK